MIRSGTRRMVTPAWRVGVAIVCPATVDPSGATKVPVTRAGVVSVIRTAMNERCRSHRRRTVMIRIASFVVIGVVLSGYQDCGTAGMISIKARGGLAVVQTPESAAAPDMPRHVIDRVPVDHIVHPRELPALLTTLAGLQKPEGNLDGARTSITHSGGRDLQIETTALSVNPWPGMYVFTSIRSAFASASSHSLG